MIDHIEKSTNPLQKSKTMKSEHIEPEAETLNIDYLGEKKFQSRKFSQLFP